MVDVCMNRPIKVALANEYTKCIAAHIREQFQAGRGGGAITAIPLRQLKAQLTESLHQALSNFADGEIIRHGWQEIGTNEAWDARFLTGAEVLNAENKLFAAAPPDNDESVVSERGSSNGESGDEELACSDLLEARAAVDPTVAAALHAFTIARKKNKEAGGKRKRGPNRGTGSSTGHADKKTGKASIGHYCKAKSQPAPRPAAAVESVVPAIGSTAPDAQAMAQSRQQGMSGQFWCPRCKSVQSLIAVPEGHECQACCEFVDASD
jgi:hypothetical protein